MHKSSDRSNFSKSRRIWELSPLSAPQLKAAVHLEMPFKKRKSQASVMGHSSGLKGTAARGARLSLEQAGGEGCELLLG